MKIKLEMPHPMDAQSIDIDKEARVCTIVPVSVRGQSTLRVAYLQAEGKEGNVAQAVLTFNQRTGQFGVQNIGGTTVKVSSPFDLPAEEFQRKMHRRKPARKRTKNSDGSAPERDDAAHIVTPANFE